MIPTFAMIGQNADATDVYTICADADNPYNFD